jgi:hypothetical protein
MILDTRRILKDESSLKDTSAGEYWLDIGANIEYVVRGPDDKIILTDVEGTQYVC